MIKENYQIITLLRQLTTQSQPDSRFKAELWSKLENSMSQTPIFGIFNFKSLNLRFILLIAIAAVGIGVYNPNSLISLNRGSLNDDWQYQTSITSDKNNLPAVTLFGGFQGQQLESLSFSMSDSAGFAVVYSYIHVDYPLKSHTDKDSSPTPT